MLKAIVADDSLTTCHLLKDLLQRDAEIQVVGLASDGREAVAMVQRLRPDVVIMDLQMPHMNGLEATAEIMTSVPTPIVIVTASIRVGDVDAGMQALRAGALTVLEKPHGSHQIFERSAREMVDTVKALAQVKVVRRSSFRRVATSPPTVPTPKSTTRAQIVAIAASTGGPPALQILLAALPTDFPLPIVVVQHISHGFSLGLARWLDTRVELNVKLAEAGQRLQAGVVYVAPEDRHLGVTGSNTIELSASQPVGGFRPSATSLFESVAKSFGSSAVAIILTGMGSDGLRGLRAIQQAGGFIIAQNEESCVVYGMPRAAVDAGLAHLVAPLSEISAELLAHVGRTPRCR